MPGLDILKSAIAGIFVVKLFGAERNLDERISFYLESCFLIESKIVGGRKLERVNFENFVL